MHARPRKLDIGVGKYMDLVRRKSGIQVNAIRLSISRTVAVHTSALQLLCPGSGT